jgi:hypothetical protein
MSTSREDGGVAMDDDVPISGPIRRGRPGPFERAYARATRGRFARLKEMAFFIFPAVLVVSAAWTLNDRGWLNDPLALLLGIVGSLYGSFGLLPPIRQEAPAPRNPKSLRGR